MLERPADEGVSEDDRVGRRQVSLGDDPLAPMVAPVQASPLWNPDLAPTDASQRTWTWYHFTALWVGMIVAVPSWMLAAGLIDQGLSAMQAVAAVLAGNVIILLPIMLIGHAGAKYGIPFAILARASFGTQGAKLPAMARALVACGWFGIQTWIGAETLLTLLGLVTGDDFRGAPLPVLGIGFGQLVAFAFFWLIQLFFVFKGISTIRRLETWTAPFKIIACGALVWWILSQAGGFGPILEAPSAFGAGQAKAGQFWPTFLPILTAMVGFWGTLALNIPDFTRFARSQKDQAVGQAVGLPPFMALIALASVITTSATVIIYGRAIWDPVQLAGTLAGPFVLVGLLVISVDTVSCNIAANLVGAAFDFSSLSPSRISYRSGALLTAIIGALIMPWRLLASTDGYIFTWLTGYSALLGPVVGILISDYWILRRARLDVDGLYRPQGPYFYRSGWNLAALAAYVLAVLPNIPGFLHAAIPGSFGAVGEPWLSIYEYAWFVGTLSALLIYMVLMKIAGVAR